MLGGIIKSLQIGIRRRWRTGITQALSVAGTVWLITEIVTKVSDQADHWVKDHGDYYSAIVVAAAATWFIRHIYEVRSVSFNLPTTNTKIEIRYGDLFKEQTDWLIGVGEYFDSEVGQVVSKNSLHGKLINNVYNGDAATFRSLVDAALVGVKSTRAPRLIAPKSKYEIGTTAVLANGSHKVFLVAMSRTHPETHKASSDVPTLWIWPPAFAHRISNSAVRAIHIPFKQRAIDDAIRQFDHNNLPTTPLSYYTAAAHRSLGIPVPETL